jgi:ATP-binding cassette subfamily F protein uup
MAVPRNFVNLNAVGKGYGSRSVLQDLTLGIAAGERIGIVGRNGDGKSTLLRLIAGAEQPDSGAITRARDLDLALLGQGDELDEQQEIRAALVGRRTDHEWAADSAFRAILDGLLGDVQLRRFPAGWTLRAHALSAGERRRIAIARLLLDGPELLPLDEPTNHLDAGGRLARAQPGRAARRDARRHPRPLVPGRRLTATREVAGETFHQYDGGYASTGERADRRRAGLRDRTELLRFATARLGSKVLDGVDVWLAFGEEPLLRVLTWRLDPGRSCGAGWHQRFGKDGAAQAPCR